MGKEVKYAIGRPIEGVSLNGVEYMLEKKDGDVKTFKSRAACLNYIQNELGIEGDDANDYVFEYNE